MVGKTAPIRKQDRERFEAIRETGCIACLVQGHPNAQTSVEHITDRGRRVGGAEQHQHSIGLCAWHHFGTLYGALSAAQMTEWLGPSLALGRVPFEDFFGPEELLLQVQNELIERYRAEPWGELDMPREMAWKSRRLWYDLRNSPV